MINSQTLQQFNSLLEASKAYQWLSTEQKVQIKSEFAQASDQKLQLAINTLQKEEAANAVNYLKIEKNEKLQQELKGKIKGFVRKLTKEQLKDQEKMSKTKDKSSLSSLNQQLEDISKSNEKPVKKKILGIF